MVLLYIAIIAAIAIAVLLYKIDNKNKEAMRERAQAEIESEARDIAEKITTLTKYDALALRSHNADIDADDNSTPARIRKAAILELAVELASSQTVKWQYTPMLDLSLTSIQVNNAYKVFSPSDYSRLVSDIDSDESNWAPLTVDDEPCEQEEEIIFLKKLHKILDSDKDQNEKIKSVNRLATAMISDIDNLGEDVLDDNGAVILGEMLRDEGRLR